jgi:hypothetical protein
MGPVGLVHAPQQTGVDRTGEHRFEEVAAERTNVLHLRGADRPDGPTRGQPEDFVDEDLEVLLGEGKRERLNSEPGWRVGDGGLVGAVLALDEQIEVQVGAG